MSGYWPSNQRVTSQIGAELSPGPTTGIAENFDAVRQDALLNNNGASQYMQVGQAYAERAKEIERLTGKRLENPITRMPVTPADELLPGAVEKMRRGWIDEFEAEADRLRETHPEIQTNAQMREWIARRSAAIETRAVDVGDRAALSGKIAGFAGAVAGSLQDPLLGSTLVFGAIGSTSILKTALMEAGIAAGTEAAVQPQIQISRKERALEGGFGQGAANVAMAGAGGFVLGGTAKAIEQLMGRKLVRAFDETIKNPTPAQVVARDMVERLADIEDSNPLDSSIPTAAIEHDDRLGAAMAAIERGAPVQLAPAEAPLSPRALQPGQDNLDGVIWGFNPEEIGVDAKTFQFKEGGDDAGVTERLRGVKEWDPVKAGQVLVYEYQDGRRFIADGHQRLGLAKRLQGEQPDSKITVYGQLFREEDGFSPEMVRVVAAMKNIAEGTGTAVDAAKVLRVDPGRMKELPPRSALVRQAADMMDLSDEAFGMVINDVIDANYAAIVGRLVKEPQLQMAVMDVLARTEPANAVQAEAIVRQAMEFGAKTDTQMGLFGEETMTTFLFSERAKVLDKALKKLRQDAKVFDTLLRNEDRIAAEGNVLRRSANEQRAATDARAAQMIQTLASRKGALSDALTEAARRASNEGRYTGATDQFIDAVRSAIERGDFDGVSPGAARGGDEAPAQGAPGDGRAVETGFDETTLKLFDTPAGAGAEQQARALEADLNRQAGRGVDRTDAGDQQVIPGAERISDKEAADRKADQKLKPSAAQKPADEGLFDEVARQQQDFLDMAVPTGQRVDPETGAVVPEARTVRDILEELDADAADLEAITKCGSP